MKKLTVLLLALLLAVVSLSAAAQTLRVGMECNYAPFNWTQSEPSENAIAIAAGG